jgi:hypothetical protein
MLQIAFGFLGIKHLHVLDEKGMDQYVEQGGGSVLLGEVGEGTQGKF